MQGQLLVVLPLLCRRCCCSLLVWVTETWDWAVLALAVRLLFAKLSRLTLTEDSDSVTSGHVRGELAMEFAPMGESAESALHSLSPNNSDQASLAVLWLITLYGLCH